MIELECQIEQDDGKYFILYIAVQRALCVQNFVAQCETLAHQIPR
jgi:hypothetical protein